MSHDPNIPPQNTNAGTGADSREGLPRWAIIASVALLALTALAAPFYGNAMAGLIWAGQSIQALCGW